MVTSDRTMDSDGGESSGYFLESLKISRLIW